MIVRPHCFGLVVWLKILAGSFLPHGSQEVETRSGMGGSLES